MDNVIPLLLVAIFYLGPALLKHYRSKVNPQHEMQETPAPEIKADIPKNTKKSKHTASVANPPIPVPKAAVQQVPAVGEETSSWNGKLDHNMLINGVIFAEILQPPRAYRPFGKR